MQTHFGRTLDPLPRLSATAPGSGFSPYQAMIPTFIAGWDSVALKARVVFGIPEQDDRYVPQDAGERRYALHMVKQRLHQASFREAVGPAYAGRCANSRLPEQRLLVAAHIASDKHARPGQAVGNTALPPSNLHKRKRH